MKLPGRDEQKKPIIIKKGSTMGMSEVANYSDTGGPEMSTAPALLPADVFDLAAAQSKLDAWEGKAIDLESVATNYKITTDANLTRGAEMIGQAKALGKDLDRAAEAIYINHYNFYKSVLNMKKVITQHLDAAQRALTKTSNEFAYQKELDRRAEEKKAKDEAAALQKRLDKDAKKKGVAPVKMQTAPVVGKPHGAASVKTQSGSLSTKMVWTFEFTDFKTKAIFDYVLQVCAKEYVAVATKAIGKMVKAGIHEGIKGVRFFESASTTHRAR